MSKSKSSGGCGCGATIVTLIVLWAILFGVTVGGKHYEFGCDSHSGVKIEPRRKET